ncbi:MAG: sulfite exporter TauE/SafE family protein, partial [Deferrisomatales bacterium]|nr:sulfite exporter TauE/SafE family protein [Deferrisomatales bacterium]
AGFFVVGVYGGFVQAGVGFFILAATTLAGLDLVRGNAVKVLSVLVLTALSLAVFASHGKVDWVLGFSLGAGNTVGGFIGVRLAILRGHEWLRKVVTACVIFFALLLLLRG